MSGEERESQIVIWTDIGTKLDWVELKERVNKKTDKNVKNHDLLKDMIENYRLHESSIEFTE